MYDEVFLPDVYGELRSTSMEWERMQLIYDAALREVNTKLETLNNEFKIKHQYNPIEHMTSRIKSPESIAKKMQHNSRELTVENIVRYINDVAGIRVICSYIDDIYLIADALLRQDDITLIAKKDYIEHPKENGYRSLHLIVEVPVFLTNHKKPMKVEVQIRTIAMDFWASLEHQMKYKQEIPDSEEIINELRDCAAVIRETDERMLAIRRRIEAAADVPTEEEMLFDKLARFDIPIQ